MFFDWPLPKLLEYGTRPPSTQKISKVPDWPPLNTKIILSSEQILYQNSQGLSQILVLRGASLGLSQICVEGGQVPYSNNLGGASKKTPCRRHIFITFTNLKRILDIYEIIKIT